MGSVIHSDSGRKMSEPKGKSRQMPEAGASAQGGAGSQSAERRAGLLRRFFHWLTKGAEASRNSRTSCFTWGIKH